MFNSMITDLHRHLLARRFPCSFILLRVGIHDLVGRKLGTHTTYPLSDSHRNRIQKSWWGRRGWSKRERETERSQLLQLLITSFLSVTTSSGGCFAWDALGEPWPVWTTTGMWCSDEYKRHCETPVHSMLPEILRATFRRQFTEK